MKIKKVEVQDVGNNTKVFTIINHKNIIISKEKISVYIERIEKMCKYIEI